MALSTHSLGCHSSREFVSPGRSEAPCRVGRYPLGDLDATRGRVSEPRGLSLQSNLFSGTLGNTLNPLSKLRYGHFILREMPSCLVDFFCRVTIKMPSCDMQPTAT